jgi:hypothetical protein
MIARLSAFAVAAALLAAAPASAATLRVTMRVEPRCIVETPRALVRPIVSCGLGDGMNIRRESAIAVTRVVGDVLIVEF